MMNVVIPLLWLGCKPTPTPVPTPVLPWIEPTLAGPHAVGVQTLEIDGPHGVLTVELWYPAAAGSTGLVRYDLPYVLDAFALRDATPDADAHPVVAFSHGHGGTRHQSIFLMERLASHGMIVVSPDHPFDTAFDLDSDRTAEVASLRPGDVSQVLDWVLGPDAPVLADPDHLAIAGHSFGAWTALVLAGGGLDLEAGAAACGQPSPPAGCRIVGSVASPAPGPDPRFGAAVLLAPGGAYSFTSLGQVAPVLVVGGTADSDLPWDEEQEPVFAGLGDPKNRLALQGGGHFGFTDACALVPLADCAGSDAGFMDPLRMQELTATVTTAWLGRILLDDERYEPWLQEDAWEPDARWE